MTDFRPSLAKLRKKYAEKKVVMAVGVFDILHPGHLEYLEFAKDQGDVLVVAIGNDLGVRKRKGAPRPFLDEYSRAKILSSLRMVDHVYICEGDEGFAEKVYQRLHPDIVVIYQDWKKADEDSLRKAVAPNKVVVYKNEKLHSTTNLIQKIIDSAQ